MEERENERGAVAHLSVLVLSEYDIGMIVFLPSPCFAFVLYQLESRKYLATFFRMYRVVG